MRSHTIRTRAASLVQKCRKALRLYTTMGRMQGGGGSDHSDRQIQIWREVNADLLNELMAAMENTNLRTLVNCVYTIRDRFYSIWRQAESELHLKQKDLLLAAENGDFVKAALLSGDLVVLKAKMQASQAVHHELQEVLALSKAPRPAKTTLNESELDDSPLLQQAKVIPLRRKGNWNR